MSEIMVRLDLTYRLDKMRDKLMMAFVWALPRWLVYWCAIRLVSYATTGKHANTVVPDLTCMDALKRWENDD